jgi:hypothetical protein
MAPDTILTLGDFAFSRYEIPEHLNFGGEQMLAVQKLVGGTRVVDAMGRDDAPIEWSGLFFGQNALERAQYLDGLRVAGKPLSLRWGDFDYTVVIQRFHGNYQRFYQVPYTISCLVVQDNALPVTNILSPGIDDLITQDATDATTLADGIGDSMLSGLMLTLNSAIGSVSSFANAAQSTINSVLQPLADVQARVGVLITSVNNTVANVSTVGGVLPNTPVAQSAASMLGQMNAMTQMPQLLNLRNVLGRMGGNLGTIGTSQTKVTQAGGDLYSLAAKQFGDATAWTTIANANGLSDPKLTGVNTLAIPPASDGSGGVLSA